MDTLHLAAAAVGVVGLILSYLFFQPSQKPVKAVSALTIAATATAPLWSTNPSVFAAFALFAIFGLYFSIYDFETMTIPVLPWLVVSPFVALAAALAARSLSHSWALIITVGAISVVPLILIALVELVFRLIKRRQGLGGGDFMLLPLFCLVPALLVGDPATIFHALFAAVGTNLVFGLILTGGKRGVPFPAVPGLFTGPLLLTLFAVI